MTRVLLCLPPAGCVRTAFSDWPAEVGGRAVRPVRESRSRAGAPTTMRTHIGEIVLQHSEVFEAESYDILGHSIGAYIAMHLIGTIADLDLPRPGQLIVLAARPPSHPDPEAPLHLLPDRRLAERLAGYGGLSPAELANPELVELSLALVRLDLQLAELAPPIAEPLPTPITALGGRDDVYSPVALLPHWAPYSAAAVTWQDLPGGHFFHGEDQPRLLRAVAAALTRGSPIRTGGSR